MENTKITLRNKEGKEYILEYNRESVQQIEKIGFSLNDLTKKPMTMFPLLFRGAFIKNCRFVKEKEINEIYEKIKKKTELHEKLTDMITECYLSLADDENADEGNAEWEMI